MKKVATLLLVIFLGCSGGYVLYDRQQSAAKISASLDEVRATLKEAQDEEAQYSSGLIKALISVRIQVLKTTTAMLEQKQQSLFHRIDLTYTIAGAPLQPMSQEQLDKIQADISEVDRKIAEADLENEKYVGGLIKGLIEMRIQTTLLHSSTVTLMRLSRTFCGKPNQVEKIDRVVPTIL